MSETTEALSAIANIIVGLSAFAAAIAAFIGLDTWKKQFSWQQDHELARRALLAFYAFRDSLFAVRSHAIATSEMEIRDKDDSHSKARSEYSAGVINAYRKRWERHQPNGRALEAIILEADVIWGPTLKNHALEVQTLEYELKGRVGTFLSAHHMDEGAAQETYLEYDTRQRDILHDTWGDERDEFRSDYVSAMKPIEEYLRHKLGRKS